jgi:hypothetical protein
VVSRVVRVADVVQPRRRFQHQPLVARPSGERAQGVEQAQRQQGHLMRVFHLVRLGGREMLP